MVKINLKTKRNLRETHTNTHTKKIKCKAILRARPLIQVFFFYFLICLKSFTINEIKRKILKNAIILVFIIEV